MRYLGVLALVVLATVPSTPAARQSPSGGASAQPPSRTPIFRLSVSLVQLDVVVTDRHGRHVPNLGPQDFEVYQDGKPQPVTAVSYVDAADNWVDTSGLPPLPVESIRPRDARRVMAVVVDDLRMSFGSIYYARRALKRFAEREFKPGDLAMLATTSTTMGYRPVVTSSSIELEAAVKRLRYSLWADYEPGPLDRGVRLGDGIQESNFYERALAMDAIAEIEAVIGLLRPLPGRKSITLVSEGFKLFGQGIDNSLIQHVLHNLVDVANRAGVVIYALDPRGLVVTGLMADDAYVDEAALRDSQDGLRFLAAETGGFAVVDSNDLAGGLRRIVTDQAGYYLVGYQPDAGTVRTDGSGKYLRVKVRVKPKGLRVRTRSGFYANASE